MRAILFSFSENALFRDRKREQSVKDVTSRQNRQTLNKKHRTQNTADKNERFRIVSYDKQQETIKIFK